MARDVHGILLLDKPLGLSSAQAVGRVKFLFGARKAGHTGSLDPLASGLLPVCFGEATKFGTQLLDADKVYRVTARMGERTATADLESAVIERRELPSWSERDLEAALAAFPRDYSQVPPMHSAIKQDGRPLYEYARAGVVRERTARSITIHELRLLEWRAPDLSFEVRCTKGTYIRVLAEDLAARLGTVAHLTVLRRTGVEPFIQRPMHTLEALQGMTQSERLGALLPLDAALAGLDCAQLPPALVGAFRQGQSVGIAPRECGPVRVYADGLGFLGLGTVEAGGRLVPQRLIATTGAVDPS